jgi:hypothetical protein
MLLLISKLLEINGVVVLQRSIIKREEIKSIDKENKRYATLSEQFQNQI